MPAARWKKLLACCLAIPVVMAAAAWVVVVILEGPIDKEILAQEAILESHGLRVGSYGDSENAAPEIKAAEIEIVKVQDGEGFDSSRGLRGERILKLLEAAALKPYLDLTGMSKESVEEYSIFGTICKWGFDYTGKAVAAKDEQTLERLLALRQRLIMQCEVVADLPSTGTSDVEFDWDLNSSISTPWARTVCRKFFEKLDPRPITLAKISGACFDSVRNIHVPGQFHESYPGYRTWRWRPMSWNPIFVKRGQLAILKALIRLRPWDLTLRQEDLTFRLRGELMKVGTDHAAWAAEQISTGMLATNDERSRRIMLIRLDLMDSWDAGKPLKPTWSKPYCFEPSNNEPMAVACDGKQMTLTTKEWVMQEDFPKIGSYSYSAQ